MGIDIGKFFTRALHVGDDKIALINAVAPIAQTAIMAGSPAGSGYSATPGTPQYEAAAGMSKNTKYLLYGGVAVAVVAAILIATG